MNTLAVCPAREKGLIPLRPPKRSALGLRNKPQNTYTAHLVLSRRICFLLVGFTYDRRNRWDGASTPPKPQGRDTHPKGGVFSV